jgi:hypothetical protein
MRVRSAAWVFRSPTAPNQFQSCTDSALRIVLMGLRVAKIDEYAIAHVLGDKTTKPRHCLRNALLLGGNNLADVLRVHARRKPRRPDEV